MHYPILILNKKKEEKPTRKTRLAQCSFFKLAWRRAGQLKVPSRKPQSGPPKMAGQMDRSGELRLFVHPMVAAVGKVFFLTKL
jgi:hypothetical protein